MRRLTRWIGDRFAMIAAVLVLLYLFLPVLYVFIFSFNDYRRNNLTWNSDAGPTLKHWANPCGAPGICEALGNSLKVGLLATLVATVLGTMIAIALVRYRFRGKGAGNMLVFVPMATPEIVLGASLLTIFVQGFSNVGLRLGFWTIVIAHIMFCLSFVVVTVRARLQSLDPRLEEAAQDLFAGPGETFMRVTLPLIMPGVAGAAMLAFSLSFDDFIITNFVSGDTNTFPKFVYVSYLRGIPAQANVIGFSLFVIAVVLVVLGQRISMARANP
ncbi:ABC transporter permease [Janibacter alkaliphilus]|uniref:Spermidine/putrescine transport system permease protein n=1 Tax=Janibacter alkaliphilus TaxID=1069963 RepID=A0A852X7W5_9MICO|nr:ABC transporter permease [Janibacter alkaliphilus]NYG37570.1 spermidine/putrescine transport system permease protein [Janibacter alkaliphilus]